MTAQILRKERANAVNTGVLYSSKKSDWNTPQVFFEELNTEFNFELDAAATDETAKCERYFTPETDGLTQPWDVSPGRAVFCNPPYCRETGKWVKRAYEEARKGTTVVMLLPSRTDVSWFHDYVLGKAEVRFLRGRLKFEDDKGSAKNSAPFPSLVAIYRGQKRKAQMRGMNNDIAFRSAERGYLDPPEYDELAPVCPVCLKECDTVYRAGRYGEIVGCNECLASCDAWDAPECTGEA